VEGRTLGEQDDDGGDDGSKDGADDGGDDGAAAAAAAARGGGGGGGPINARDAFVAPEGHVLLAAVYGQVELWMMAHMSQARGVTWGCYVVYVGM
jgi:hypothetical protein